jgi:hypothetical protein
MSVIMESPDSVKSNSPGKSQESVKSSPVQSNSSSSSDGSIEIIIRTKKGTKRLSQFLESLILNKCLKTVG